MRCQVCEDVASSSETADRRLRAGIETDLFCERCGVALPPHGAVEPMLRRLSQLARFGVAGLTGRRFRSRAPKDS